MMHGNEIGLVLISLLRPRSSTRYPFYQSMYIITTSMQEMQFLCYPQHEYVEKDGIFLNPTDLPVHYISSPPSTISSAASSVGSHADSTCSIYPVSREHQDTRTETDGWQHPVYRCAHLGMPSCPPSQDVGQDVVTHWQENAKGYPLFAAGDDRYADLSYFDRTIGNGNGIDSPSTTDNSIEENAAVIPHKVWSSSQNTFAYTAEWLVRGVRSFATVSGTIKKIHNLHRPLGHYARAAAEEELRFHVMCRFAKIWHPVSGNTQI